MAHADLVVIGKSFLGRGGQNPVEAIAAGAPVVCGPHMSNFEPLFTELCHASAIECVGNTEITTAIRGILESEDRRRSLTNNARMVIDHHRGATVRIISLLEEILGAIPILDLD